MVKNRTAETENRRMGNNPIKQILEGHDFKPIPLNRIRADPENPRRKKDIGDGTLGDLSDLRASIEKRGLQVALMVEEVGTNLYQLIDGERRFTVLKQISGHDLASVLVACDVKPRLDSFQKRALRIELDRTHEQWTPAVRIQTIKDHYDEWIKNPKNLEGAMKNAKHPAITTFARTLGIGKETVVYNLEIRKSDKAWEGIVQNKFDVFTAREVARYSRNPDPMERKEQEQRLLTYGTSRVNPEIAFAPIGTGSAVPMSDKHVTSFKDLPQEAIHQASKVYTSKQKHKTDPDEGSRRARDSIISSLDKFGLYFTAIKDQIKFLDVPAHQETVKSALERNVKAYQKLVEILEKKVRTGSTDY